MSTKRFRKSLAEDLILVSQWDKVKVSFCLFEVLKKKG